jgi:NADPH:quinone reductase
MRAFTLDGFDAQPVLREDLPDPSIGDNELLVRVRTSSVNPVDVFIAAGGLRQFTEYEFPVTIGRDFAGEVERVGSGVSRYQVGDEVFGFVLHANPTVRDGSWAELIAVPEDFQVAAKPSKLSFAESGATPLAGIAALDAFDAIVPREGGTVLVIGATGGVGSFFVQLAAAAGAHVVAPALPEDHDYLRALGVSELVERDDDFAAAREAHPDGVDAVLDLVSHAPDTTLLKEGGRLASTMGAAGDGEGRFNIIAQPTPADLQRVGELVETGKLRVHIQRDYTLEHAGEALAALPGTHTRGKLSLTIA